MAMAGKFDRFVDQEFLEQTREFSSFLISDFNRVVDFVQTLDIGELQGSFRERLAEWIALAKGNLSSAIDNTMMLPAEQSLREAYRIQEKMREYQAVLSFLKQAVDQRFHSHVTEKIHFFEPTREEFIGSKVYRAIDNLVASLIGKFFPEYIANKTISIIVFTSVPGYQVWIPSGEPAIAIVQVPSIDLHRCRYWTCLGHETAHQRYGAYPISEVDHLGSRYDELKNEMVQDLENLALRIYGSSSRELALSQFQEILCDLSSVMLLGPSDLLTLMTTISYPRLAGTAYNPHPPLAARVRYLFKYLTENLHSTSAGIFEKRLAEWRSSWNFVEQTIPRPMRERLFLEGFDDIFTHYYNDLIAIARDFLEIPDSLFFKPEIWESAEQASEGQGQDEQRIIDDFHCLHLAWAKRWKTFMNVYRGSNVEFINYHMFERKATYDVISTLRGGE